MHTHFLLSIFSIFLFFYFLYFFIFFGLGPAQPTWAGLDPASPARSLVQASDPAGPSQQEARVDWLHAGIMHSAKVINLPSHRATSHSKWMYKNESTMAYLGAGKQRRDGNDGEALAGRHYLLSSSFLFVFFGKVSPSGWGKASFLLRGSGKNLKSSSGFFVSFSFPVLPLFRLCSSPARSCVFFSVFVSWVHPCSKSLSISLCLTLPCICPFFFLVCEFVLWRWGWICGTLAFSTVFSSSPLFFFVSLSVQPRFSPLLPPAFLVVLNLYKPTNTHTPPSMY